MMRKISVILVGTVLLATSCKKELGESVVQGTVTDVSTGKPANGALVKLLNEFHEKKTSAVDERVEATAITDADGHYKINYTRKSPEWQNAYSIATFWNDTFITESNKIAVYQRMSTVDLNVHKKGFVKFKLTKTSTKPCKITFKVDVENYPYLSLQNSIYTDSTFKLVLPVRGNLNSLLCVSAEYVNDNVITKFCSSEQFVAVGDTVVFSVTYE